MGATTVIQMQRADNGAAALATMLATFGRHISLEEARTLCPSSRNGTQPELLAEAARAYGMDVRIEELDPEGVRCAKKPLLVQYRRKAYVVVRKMKRGRVSLSDPAKGDYDISEEAFFQHYSGIALPMEPGPDFERGGRPEKLTALLAKRLGGIKRELVGLFLVNLAVVGLDLLFVNFTKDLLNTEAAQDFASSMESIVAPSLIALSVLLACAAFSARKTLALCEASRRVAATSGANLFKHIFRMPIEFFDNVSAGELMQRMENNAKLDRSLIQSIIPRMIDAVTCVAYLALMFSYNVWVALACLIVEIAYLVAMHAQRNAIALQSRSVVSSSGSLNSKVLNGLGTIETIKISGTERVFFGLWKESQDEFQLTNKNSLKTDAITKIIQGVHGVLSSAALLFVGAHFMVLGEFTAATLTAMQMVVNKVGNSLSNCMNTLNGLNTMRTNIERVEDLNRRQAIASRPLADGAVANKILGDLVVEHVSYRYNPGDPPAVDDVSLSVKYGQMVAIVGKTGCGKSTLLKLIADLYTMQEGRITYAGCTRDQISDVEFRSSVVTVDQEAMMFEDSVRANLKMWDETIEDFTMAMAANSAQIHERIIRDREGYDAVVLENGKNFSGGELQRMELARALEMEPTILLLDEFTSALDALTEERVMRQIRLSEATCVIVAHRLSTIRDADQIIVMDKGRIVQVGTHDALMAEGGLYRDLVSTE